MNGFLLFVAGLIALVLGVLFAAPLVIDWNDYRDVFAVQASKLVGREVRVGGDVNLRLLPAPYVRFENVRIADENGRFAKPFLRMDRFTMWLSIPPLLQGRIEAREIELTRPRLRLAIDETGKGNWQGLGGGEMALPFVPKEVALKAVDIANGRITLESALGDELLRLESITGTLSAPALQGPFKFRGTFASGGKTRHVRFSTGHTQPGGGTLVKGLVRAEGAGNRYAFDGRLFDLFGQPRLEGTLSATLPLAALTGKAGGPAGAEGDGLEVKARMKVDVAGLRLDDIAFSFQRDGRPQSISGMAVAQWVEGTKIRANLHARWLDLDQLLGLEKGVAPMRALAGLAGRFASLFPERAHGALTVGIEQANFGGETVTGVALEVERNGEVLTIRRLAAGLPGASHVRVSGTLAEDEGEGEGEEASPRFEGTLQLRGHNVARLLSWVAPGQGVERVKAVRDGYFALSGRLTLARQGWSIERARGEFAETVFNGLARYARGAGKRTLTLRLDSDRLDLAALGALDLPALTIADLRDLLASQAKARRAGKAATGATPAPRPLRRLVAMARGLGRVDLAVRIGHLRLKDGSLRNVSAALGLKDGALAVRRLSLQTDTGLEIGLDGTLGPVGGADPRGILRLTLEARQVAALGALERFLALPPALGAAEREALVPLRLAGTLTIGRRGKGTADLVMDGAARDSHTSLILRYDGDFSRLATGRVDLTAVMENLSGSRLLAQLFPRIGKLGPGAPATGPRPERSRVVGVATAGAGRLSVRLSGVPAEGMSSVVRIQSAPLAGAWDGRITVTEAGIGAKGRIALAATSGTHALALVGLERAFDLSRAPLALEAQIGKEGKALRLSDVRLSLAGVNVGGEGVIDWKGERTRIDVSARAARASLAKLLAAIVSRRDTGANPAAALRGPVAESGAPGATPGAAPIWTDAPFDLALVKTYAGAIRLDAGRIEMLDGLGLARGRIEARFGGGKLDLDVAGRALGGTVRAKLAVAARTAGAAVKGELQLSGVDLAAFTPAGGQPAPGRRAQGRVTLRLAAQGQGLSPRGAVAVLNGKGRMVIGPGRLERFSPDALASAARALVARSGRKIAAEDVASALAERLAEGAFPLPVRDIPLTIADGVIRAQPVTFEAGKTRLAIRTFVDLSSLAVDSEWTLRSDEMLGTRSVGASGQAVASAPAPRDGGAPSPATTARPATPQPLPPVVLVYAGPVTRLARLAPRIDAEQLARELTVRRMELDVARLEELRRQDEQRRARLEAERARAAEEARRRAIEALTAPLGGQGEGASGPPSPQAGGPPGRAPGTGADAALSPPRLVLPPATPGLAAGPAAIGGALGAREWRSEVVPGSARAAGAGLPPGVALPPGATTGTAREHKPHARERRRRARPRPAYKTDFSAFDGG